MDPFHSLLDIAVKTDVLEGVLVKETDSTWEVTKQVVVGGWVDA